MRFRLPLTAVGAVLFMTGVVFLSIGCEHDIPAGPAQVQPVQPLLSDIQAKIFTLKCVNAGCHPGGGAPMSLATGTSYTTLVGPGGTGVVSSGYAPRLRVSPGNANNSVLYLKIAGTTLGSRMPLNQQPLSAAEISAIQTWINNGAQNN